jgi:4'-phosphopantetheinyl transferase EntD
MPVILLHHDTPQHALAVWRMDESTETLMTLAALTTKEEAHCRAIKLEKRRREWLAARLLRNQLLPDAAVLNHANGKPYIAGGPFISFSHSDHFAALMTASVPCGVDIQRPDPKLARIQTKYILEEDMAYAPDDAQDRLRWVTIVWSAKEAIFKCFGEHVHFASDIRMHPFTPTDSLLSADYHGVHGTLQFTLEVRRMDDYYFTLTPALNTPQS